MPEITVNALVSNSFKQYADNICGITISYPSDWQVEKCVPSTNPLGQPVLLGSFYSPNKDISVSILIFESPGTSSLNEFLKSLIDGNKEEYEDYKVIESNTDASLSGNPAFRLVDTLTDQNFGKQKVLQLGTLVNGKVYSVAYYASPDKYSQYMPTIKPMIDSFKIGESTTDVPNTGLALSEDCANGLDDDGDAKVDADDQDCPLTTAVMEICDNGVDDDADGLSDTDDIVDCPVSEEQRIREQTQLQDILVDIAPPNMNREQVAEKFPITEGELPKDFRLVQAAGNLSESPRLDYLGQWSKEDLNIYVLADPQNKEQSQKFIVDAKNAVVSVSQVLKNNSENPNAFNLKILEKIDKNSPEADIVITLEGDPTGDKGCIEVGGSANLHDDAAIPLYAQIFTFCLNDEVLHDSVYTTVKHELLHTLGLGHAHHINGDLMCSTEPDVNGNPVSTCDVFAQALLTEPSQADIDSLVYMYGKDGFGGKNENVDSYPHYDVTSTPTDTNTIEGIVSPTTPPNTCRFPFTAESCH